MKRKKKKAVSLMLSYVLLIVIAIALAIGIYSWWRFIVKGVEPIEECPEGVSLIIRSYQCLADKKVGVEVENKGRFNVSGYVIRGGDNKSQEAWVGLKYSESFRGDVEGLYLFKDPLPPGSLIMQNFSYDDENLEKLEKIEIEPIRIQEKELGRKTLIYCDHAVISQEANCV